MPNTKDIAETKNLQYVYDGTLPGFFCCVYESVYSKEIPSVILDDKTAQYSLYDSLYISTDHNRADRVRNSISKKISNRSLDLIENSFLTCIENKEIKMLRYILLGYIVGKKIDNMLGHEDVAALLKGEQHLYRECHLLSGFIRFSDNNGFLTSTITPKNFVLPFLAKHFTSRFNTENFVIFDKTNKHALIYQDKKVEIIRTDMIKFSEPSSDEVKYRELWKRFYETIAIEARDNPKCRMTHMPKRYWENMTEMADKL